VAGKKLKSRPEVYEMEKLYTKRQLNAEVGKRLKLWAHDQAEAIESLEAAVRDRENIAKKHAEEAHRYSNYLTNVAGPVSETDALLSLLAIARLVDRDDRLGYDVHTLDDIVFRRIRALVRRARDDLMAWENDNGVGAVPLREAHDDEAPHC
jgi:hypothetical protein